MSSRTSFERYTSAMNSIAFKCIDSAADSIIDDTTPDPAFDTAASTLLDGFREIENTLKALDLIEAMIGVAAPRSRQVSKHEYLKFLITAYLQELYILEQRLIVYATRVQRAYKHRFDATTILQSIRKAFRDNVQARGQHVHSKRFEDPLIDFLQGAALVESALENVMGGPNLNAELDYKNLRNEWLKFVKGNSSTIQMFLQDYFERLLAGISKDGALVLPRTGRAQHVHTIPLEI